MSAQAEIDEPVETGIPIQRLAPKDHLKRAAQAPIASNAEHYHLTAAIAEALDRILGVLQLIEQHLARKEDE
jgi:hypothetical protein